MLMLTIRERTSGDFIHLLIAKVSNIFLFAIVVNKIYLFVYNMCLDCVDIDRFSSLF